MVCLTVSKSFAGGGSTEDSFQYAPKDSIRRLIWEEQVGKDEIFRPRTVDKMMENLETDPKAVVLTNKIRILDQITRQPSLCSLLSSKVCKNTAKKSWSTSSWNQISYKLFSKPCTNIVVFTYTGTNR